MLPAISGFLAGVAHVASGPDHLAAVAPLAIGRRRSFAAAVVGASWGLGHGLGVALVGAGGQLLKGVLGLGAVTAWAEVLVGVFLIGLGAWTIRKSYRVTIHEHTHGHDGDEHTHLHVHDSEPSRDHGHRAEHDHAPHRHRHAALGIGVVHGLAGSSHLYGVLPSLAMSAEQAAMYLAGYLFAAVAAMAAFGAAVGWISRVAGTRRVPLAMRVAGWVCLGAGIAWIVISASP